MSMTTPRFSGGGIDYGPGVIGNMADTLPMYPTVSTTEAPAAGGAPASVTGGTMPHVTVLGWIGLLAALWLAQRGSSYLKANTISLNVANFFIIGLTASVGILMAKVLANKFPIPNVVEAVNAV